MAEACVIQDMEVKYARSEMVTGRRSVVRFAKAATRLDQIAGVGPVAARATPVGASITGQGSYSDVVFGPSPLLCFDCRPTFCAVLVRFARRVDLSLDGFTISDDQPPPLTSLDRLGVDIVAYRLS